MSTVYCMGTENDAIIESLTSASPVERAKAAEAVGVLHIYQALPWLLDVARHDPDHDVSNVAREALAQLVPKREGVLARVLSGGTFDESYVRTRPQLEEADWVVFLFEDYVRSREDHLPHPRSNGVGALGESDLVGPSIGYLALWSGAGTQDLGEVGVAATRAVGAIARFLEIPPRDAGAKAASYRDAKHQAAQYRTLRQAAGEQ